MGGKDGFDIIREIRCEGAQTFFFSNDATKCSYLILVLHQLSLVMWVENGFAFGMVRPTVDPRMGLLLSACSVRMSAVENGFAFGMVRLMCVWSWILQRIGPVDFF